MFFNSFKSKLKKSYAAINPELQRLVFPHGEQEYIYVGTILNTLFKKQDVFKLIQIYASVYTYYKSQMGNAARTYDYAKKKTAGILSDVETKNLIALVMLNLTSNKAAISDPVEKIREYTRFINNYLETVEGIKKNAWRFKTEPISAGTTNSPILVDGICGIHEYIKALKIPGVEKVSFARTSTLHLTDQIAKVDFAIDEYTLTNERTGEKIAALWFNMYGTENTDVQPACFSDKTPFSAADIAPKVMDAGEKEWKAIKEICDNAHIVYDNRKLGLATMAYFYAVWMAGFHGIRLGQAKKLEEIYIGNFADFNKIKFAEFPYSQVVENEQRFGDMLKRVNYRVMESRERHNFTFVDDGLSEKFIREFVKDPQMAGKIQPQIASRIMDVWYKLGEEADDEYLT